MNDAAAFRAGIERLWGKHGSQAAAARAFEVSTRAIRYWVSGERPVPEDVMAQLRAMIDIAPPPGTTDDDDRDDACQDAIEPRLSVLYVEAQRAGWSPAEVATAITALGITEMIKIGGESAAWEVLAPTVDRLRRLT